MSEQISKLDDFPAWEVEALADGIPMPHITAFLEAHPAAKQAWQQQQQSSAQLEAALYRFDCPEPDRLRAYQWNELSPTEGHALRAHLAHCPDCTEELALLQTFVKTAQQAEATATVTPESLRVTLGEQLQRLADELRLVVAHLVTPLTPQTGGAALRADVTATAVESGPEHSLLFEADETDISLLIHPQKGRQLRLSGQIFTATTTVQGECKLITERATDTPLLAAIDETGTFVFENILPGTYQLTIALSDQFILIPQVAVM